LGCCRKKQSSGLFLSPRPPAAASPTWGAKKMKDGIYSRLLFCSFI